MNPPISIVVVTFHSEQFIGGCLDSIASQTEPPPEIIVVDNGSTDRTVEIVKGHKLSVSLIELKSNTGYCHACNAGLARACGEFILFANADTRLSNTYLQTALAAFESAPKTGMVAGKLLRFDEHTIDSAGQVLTVSRKIKDRGFGELDRGQYDARDTVDSVCGALAFYRREMIEHIRLDGEMFDEDFFAFWEDMDTAWRARRLGWIVLYEPCAVAYHYRGGSQTKRGALSRTARIFGRPPEIQYHIVKNRWLMLIKNESLSGYIIRLPAIFVRDIALFLFLLLRSPCQALRLLVTCPRLFARAWRKRGRITTA